MKIGFVDYYLDEWHANNYPAWIKEASGGEIEVAYAYAMTDSPHGGKTTDEWCRKFGVTRCHTTGELAEEKRGCPYNGYVRSFLNRLVKYKASVCLFADDFTVPFDNNQAERDIRFAKVKQKVSGCFRTKSGADIFALIMSYVATARKHSFDAFSAIRNALSGHPDCGIC